MRRAALHQHGYRLRHLVAHDTAGQLPLVGRRFAHALSLPEFWAITVRTRAMSLRTLRSWLVLESCCVAFCMRRPNCARSSWASSWCSSSVFFPLNSDAFTTSTSEHAGDEYGAQRQLRRRQAERLARLRLVHAVHLVQHRARLDLRHPVFRIALAVTYADFGGLLRYGLVRKDPDPDPAAALDGAGHRPPSGLDLPRGEPAP